MLVAVACCLHFFFFFIFYEYASLCNARKLPADELQKEFYLWAKQMDMKAKRDANEERNDTEKNIGNKYLLHSIYSE